MLSLIIFLLILSFLVIIHELGHFTVAKKNGIRVEEFGIGFPPKLKGIKKGETEYTINAIPLGGFVRLYGEEHADAVEGEHDRSFVSKKPYQKAAVIVAGIVVNILFGVLLFYGILAYNGFRADPLPLLFPHHFVFGKQEGRVIAAQLVKGSPAQKAGIAPEDIILSYSANEGTNTTIHSAAELIDIIKSSPGKVVHLETQNLKDGATKFVTVVPQYNPTLKRAVIGVSLIDGIVLSYPTPVDKLFSGFMHSYNVLDYNFSAVAKLVQISVKEKSAAPVSGAVSGPIGIYSVVNDIMSTSGEKLTLNILNLMALLSLSLGVMNILPLPALDGGRLVFIIYEWITGKPVHKKVESITNLVGFAFLIGLAVLVSINDILRLVK